MIAHKVHFPNKSGHVTWRGKQVTSKEDFEAYLCGPVCQRLKDEQDNQRFDSDLRALASTDMAVDTIKKLLLTTQVARQPWEIGEALAECLLEDELSVKWPWNMERDKRTPKASLPGADLIGFIKINGGFFLVIGEVKTSDDNKNPPNVMYGRTGMVNQLDKLAQSLEIHCCVLKWLYPRCKNTEFWPLFQEATRKYLGSGGRALVLFGLLMRDTNPNYLDLKNRAEALATTVAPPTVVTLDAWYMPTSINKWPSITLGG